MIARLFTAFVVLIVVPFTSAQTRPAQQPQAQSPPTAKVLQLLNASGYKYVTLGELIWKVQFKGKSMASIPVHIMAIEDVIDVTATVAENNTFKPVPPLMFRLLKFDYGSGRSVVALDDNNDLIVRTEVHTRICDLEEFKELVIHVAMTADQVDAAIKPFRVP